MLGISAPKEAAEDLRGKLTALRLVDKSKAIIEREGRILIPVVSEPPSDLIAENGAEVLKMNFPDRKLTKVDPIEMVRRLAEVPEELKASLPDKWELVGDVAIVRLSDDFAPFLGAVGEAYATALKAKAVLREVGAIRGDFREPSTELIYGHDTETTHVENRIRFRLDAARTMFSSGNEEERLRMATVRCDGETVVDMFAGIGYFSIPLAVYQKPRKVIACEINPVAHRYLSRNIVLNEVQDAVTPVLGDNRDLPGESVADRVLMGYVKTTHEYLPTAVRLLRSGGVVHYHETCPNVLLPERPIHRIRDAVPEGRVEVLRLKEIKSYAPGVAHVVVDARVFKRA